MFGSLTRLWGPVVVEDRVPAPPAAVYAVLADPTTYPEWLVGTDRIRRVDPEFPAPGSEFEHSIGPAKGATLDDRSESLEAEPAHHLALLVHAGFFHGRVDFELEPAGAGSTKVTFREQPIGVLSILTPVLRPSLAGRNALSLKQLADRLATRTVA